MGRAKDIVVRGGENISMKEVEDYLAAHPHITDVAIVGVPDDVLGERACAFVVARGGATAPRCARSSAAVPTCRRPWSVRRKRPWAPPWPGPTG